MDINQLNCFISVAQTLNFSEAARRNYLSQSTVSRYIIDLEKEFGVQLFTRSHRDVLLTNEGKTLLPYALEIVETLGKAKKVIQKLQNGGTGKLTIGCDVTSLDFPSRCIADFTARYEGVTVDLRHLDAADRTAAITGGEFDFCFMPRDMVPESSGIETLVTHSDPLVVLASAVENAFDELMEVYAAVLSQMGVSVVPQSLAALVAGSKVLALPITDADTGISYVMAWAKNISNPVAGIFLETVKKYAEGDDSDYGL